MYYQTQKGHPLHEVITPLLDTSFSVEFREQAYPAKFRTRRYPTFESVVRAMDSELTLCAIQLRFTTYKRLVEDLGLPFSNFKDWDHKRWLTNAIGAVVFLNEKNNEPYKTSLIISQVELTRGNFVCGRGIYSLIKPEKLPLEEGARSQFQLDFVKRLRTDAFAYYYQD